jgi:hypothetical protein
MAAAMAGMMAIQQGGNMMSKGMDFGLQAQQFGYNKDLQTQNFNLQSQFLDKQASLYTQAGLPGFLALGGGERLNNFTPAQFTGSQYGSNVSMPIIPGYYPEKSSSNPIVAGMQGQDLTTGARSNYNAVPPPASLSRPGLGSPGSPPVPQSSQEAATMSGGISSLQLPQGVLRSAGFSPSGFTSSMVGTPQNSGLNSWGSHMDFLTSGEMNTGPVIEGANSGWSSAAPEEAPMIPEI